jgi:hypothetical protein
MTIAKHSISGTKGVMDTLKEFEEWKKLHDFYGQSD